MVEDLSLRDVVSRVARLLHDRARGQTTLVEDSSTVSLRYTQTRLRQWSARSEKWFSAR
jgi:hypothetical protein